MSNGGGRLRNGGGWSDCGGRWINHTTSGGGGGGGWSETEGGIEEAVEAGGSEMVIIEPVYRWIQNLLKINNNYGET